MPGTAIPVAKDVEGLPVVDPAVRCFVDAAGKGQPAAGLVFDDAGLLMKDRVGSHGGAVLVAGNGHLDLKEPFGHHPCQQLKGQGLRRRHTLDRHRQQAPGHGVLE